MKTLRASGIPSGRYFQILPWLLIVLQLILTGWGPSQKPALGQATNTLRFTQDLKFQEVAPGIEQGQVTSGHASKEQLTGPWFINVLRIDLNRTRVKIVHALDEGVGLETVSSMAARYGAVAAINGGYFRTNGTYRGECLGLLLLEGKLISEPYNDRAELGLTSAGSTTQVVFGHLKFSGELSIGPAKHIVQGLNRPPSPNELIVFTSEFHRTSLTNPDGIEVVVRKNRVVAIRDLQGSSEIPPDGFIIYADGSARNWLKNHIRKGVKVVFSWQLKSITPGEDAKWQRVYSILGAGPQLIKEGKVAITDKEEKMTPTFRSDLHPRTAIARLKSGKLLLLTVDGRQPGTSMGLSLDMLAELLLEFGAVEAINLDGGGSTTMVVHDKVVNRPSDQTGERPVSDAILVFSKPK